MKRKTKQMSSAVAFLTLFSTLSSVFSHTDPDSLKDNLVIARTEKMAHDTEGVIARAAVSRENKVVAMLRAEKLDRDIQLRELDIKKRALEIALLEQQLGIIPPERQFNAAGYDPEAFG